jgi:hypothetical protein
VYKKRPLTPNSGEIGRFALAGPPESGAEGAKSTFLYTTSPRPLLRKEGERTDPIDTALTLLACDRMDVSGRCVRLAWKSGNWNIFAAHSFRSRLILALAAKNLWVELQHVLDKRRTRARFDSKFRDRPIQRMFYGRKRHLFLRLGG